MEEFFGVSMNIIAGVVLALTLAILLFVGFIAVRNPVMFKMGLRNIPRRKAQTALIVIGLMLSTVIITAAFGTGDTMNKSITAEIYKIAGQTDEIIRYNAEDFPAPEDQQRIPADVVQQMEQRFAGNPDIDALMPLSTEVLPVQNTRTRLNEAQSRIVAWRPEDAVRFGGLKDVDGKDVALAPGEMAVNEELADSINAKVGDKLVLFYEGRQAEVTVTAITPNTLLGGTLSTERRQGGAVNLDFSGLTGQGDAANIILVSYRRCAGRSRPCGRGERGH
jgi:putative ABC transport system permease protein